MYATSNPVSIGPSARRLKVLANPVGKFLLVERTRSHGEKDKCGLCLIGHELLAVELEECCGGDECNTLVAIHEGVILRESKRIRGRQARQVHVAFIGQEILRSCQRRLEQIVVA